MNRCTHTYVISYSKRSWATYAFHLNRYFIWLVILFDEDYKYGDGAKYSSYVGTNTEPLFVEFCAMPFLCKLFNLLLLNLI
jgi:hypothetical protein